jgi:UDP-3-O-[3-hydroxymyristoyl] glucosamine N-acyltransferase
VARSPKPQRGKSRPRRSRAAAIRRGRSAAPPDSFTLSDVAAAVGGRLVGAGGTRLTGVAALPDAGPGDLSFVSEPRHGPAAAASGAGAFLVPDESLAADRPCVVVRSPGAALAVWLASFRPAARPRAGVARGAHVHRTARLGRGVSIAAGATVEAGARIGSRSVLAAGAYVGEKAQLGEDCVLGPNATVADRCVVGDRCVFHAGAVVGSDGFGYVPDGEAHRKVPQVGIVRVEDDVEIGANSTVDRATLGATVIGRGTKIDNLVQVGHNVRIGEHSLLCGQAGIGGSSTLGRRVTLAGQVGISDHVTIGDGAVLTGQAGIARRGRVAAGAVLSGMPALPHREFLRRAALIGRLESALERLAALERRMGVRGNE